MKKSNAQTVVIVVGAATAVGAAVVIRVVRRRRRRVLSKKVRKAMTALLELRAEDLVPQGRVGESVFRHRISGLTDRQLIALVALVQVGHFVRTSNIDPLHPSREQVAQAIREYVSSERESHETRDTLLGALGMESPEGIRGALADALSVLAGV